MNICRVKRARAGSRLPQRQGEYVRTDVLIRSGFTPRRGTRQAPPLESANGPELRSTSFIAIRTKSLVQFTCSTEPDKFFPFAGDARYEVHSKGWANSFVDRIGSVQFAVAEFRLRPRWIYTLET